MANDSELNTAVGLSIREQMQETFTADKTIIVHKQDAEGGLVINALLGGIITPIEDRPEWASGLASALTAERYKWYLQRLGRHYVNGTMKAEQAVAFEDLGWIVVNEDGEACELEASTEWCMDKISEYGGILRTDDLEQEQPVSGSNVVETFVDMGTVYESEEVHALEKAQAADFDEKTGTK